MTLELDVNEINFILQTLGELPSKSGVWPLIVKIKEQAEAQVTKAKDEPWSTILCPWSGLRWTIRADQRTAQAAWGRHYEDRRGAYRQYVSYRLCKPHISVIMEFLEALAKGWPMLLALITLIIVLAKMDIKIAVLEEKVKSLFEIFNRKDKWKPSWHFLWR